MTEWKDVLEFEGLYEVSNTGIIRSLPRYSKLRKRMYGGKELSIGLNNKTGYGGVVLCREGVGHNRLVHRLVLEAFVGPRPDGMVCCHLDGDKLNNNLSNLRWDTRSANEADKAAHGTRRLGDEHHSSKLCELDVWLIRNCDLSQRKLAEFFGMSQTAIGAIIRRKTWKHI